MMPWTRRRAIDSSVPASSIVPPNRRAPSIGVTATRGLGTDAAKIGQLRWFCQGKAVSLASLHRQIEAQGARRLSADQTPAQRTKASPIIVPREVETDFSDEEAVSKSSTSSPSEDHPETDQLLLENGEKTPR